MKANLFYYRLTFNRPIFIQNKPLLYKEGLVLHLKKNNGLIGYGDISPLPYLSFESLHQAYRQLMQIDFNSLDKLDMKKLFPSVHFALQSALSEHSPETLTVDYCALFLGSAEEILSQIKKSKANTIKIKISPFSIEESIEIVQAILKESPKRKIRIDCNRKWSYKQASTFLNAFSSRDFEYLEEPCKTKNETLQLAKTTDFPIALDESIRRFSLSELKYIKKLVIKPSIIHPFWIDEKIPIVYSSSFESGLGIYHILSLAIKNSNIAAGVDTYKYLTEDILQEPILYKENHIVLKKPILDIDRLCPIPFN